MLTGTPALAGAAKDEDPCKLLRVREIEKELFVEGVSEPEAAALSGACEWSVAADEFVAARFVLVSVHTDRPIGRFNALKTRPDAEPVTGLRRAIVIPGDVGVDFSALRKNAVISVGIAYDLNLGLGDPLPLEPPAGVGDVIELGIKALRRFEKLSR